jgi:hypothetical protein
LLLQSFSITSKRCPADTVPIDLGLALPGRGADHAAEILGPEGGIRVGEHIGVDIAEGRFRPVVKAVVKGLDDLFLSIGKQSAPRIGTEKGPLTGIGTGSSR